MTQEERQQKFELFVQGLGIPLEVNIYKFIDEKLLGILLPRFLIIVGFILSHFITGYVERICLIFTILIISLLIFVFIYFRKHNLSQKPEVIINSDGIYTQEAKFWEWKDIQEEQIEKTDKDSYLLYKYPNGHIRLSFSSYSISASEFSFFLEKYRHLNNTKKNTFNL